MVEKIGLEAVLKMAGFNKGMKDYTDGVAKIGTTTDRASSGLDLFGSSIGKIGLAVGSVTGGIYTLAKAFEFGKEGAIISQTEESFNRLMRSMNIAPDIMDQMRAASLNTVDDMTLMSSTMTLVAGTSDELGAAMVNAAPRLLEIAKAANKLNPTLGDTSFLYQSLATGIKRSSPLILDNLGLTIKVGDANEKMAAKLGKSVEALSSEEKQMALLDAALESGARMMEQAGGSAKSMADDFLEAETRLKNVGDTVKKNMTPAIADAAEGVLDAADTANQLVIVLDATRKALGALLTLKSPTEAFNAEIERQTGFIAAQYDQLYNVEKEAGRLGRSFGELDTAINETTESIKEQIVTTQDMAKVQKALEDVIAEVQKRYESFMRSLSTGIIKLRDLGDASEDSAARYQQALSDLAKEGTKSLKQVQDGFQASLPDATTVAERMGMAEDAWDEWGLRIQDIIEQGVESPWYAVLQEMGYSKPPDVGMREWAEDLKQQFYAGQLPDLLPPEWAANVKAQQEEATRVVRAENAKRKQEIEDARQAELEAERQARNEATLELALTLAEQRGLLQAWSQERFGPDFSQVADTAAEVMGLLDAGMLDIDATLQGIIADSTAGVQTALDTTGSLAEENKKKLDELAETDYSKILSIDEIKQQWFGGVGEMFTYIEDEVPETPFDPILANFGNVSGDILNASLTMKLGLSSDFNEIDQLWAAMVLEQVKSWDVGMTDVETAIQEKVIDKLEEIPKRIVITVETETEGGTPPPRQHGGPVTAGVPYVVGEAGPELFIPDTPGQVMPNDWTMNLPALIGAGAGASTTVGPTVNLTMNPTINTPMDLAEFEMMTERTIQRAIRGY